MDLALDEFYMYLVIFGVHSCHRQAYPGISIRLDERVN